MKKRIILLVVFFLIISAAKISSATPTLGVATDTGIYAYTDSSALTDEYINYFASIITPAISPYEGFVLGPSGSSLTVFTSYNPSVNNIYLLTNSGSDNLPISFGGVSFSSMGDTGKANGYHNTPYYGAPLPTDLTSWSTHTFEVSKIFYLYTAQINYTGKLTPGEYFFAAAEINGNAGFQFQGAGKKDDFSPKTTSAGGHTPEPVTLLLFGIGMLGFGVFKRKKR